MKYLHLIVFTTLLIFIGCNDQSIEDLEVTQGKIAGKDWTFDTGRTVYTVSGIEITLMSDEKKYSNPCAISVPATPYAKIYVPAKRGNYNVSSASGSNSALVKFYEGSSSAKNLTAVSGFVNIVSLNDFSVDGIIDVTLNDDNTLKYGAFFVDNCN